MERGDEWRGKERRLDGRPQRRFLDAPLISLVFHCITVQVRIDRQIVRWRERERERDRATVHGDSALYAEALSVAIVAYLKRFPRI